MQVDVLVVFSIGSFPSEKMAGTAIASGYASMNQATTNSGIDLRFRIAGVVKVSADLRMYV